MSYAHKHCVALHQTATLCKQVFYVLFSSLFLVGAIKLIVLYFIVFISLCQYTNFKSLKNYIHLYFSKEKDKIINKFVKDVIK